MCPLDVPEVTLTDLTQELAAQQLGVAASTWALSGVEKRRQAKGKRVKKFGHEQRKTLPCPKSSGYNFVAKQKRTATDEQKHTDPRAPSSSPSHGIGMPGLSRAGTTSDESGPGFEGERGGAAFCETESGGIRSGGGRAGECERTDEAKRAKREGAEVHGSQELKSSRKRGQERVSYC